MNKNNYSNELVELVSDYIQKYMKINNINTLSADECSEILNRSGILPNNVGPKKGFNFRQLLRDGRDGNINLVKGVYQIRPRTRWLISRTDI